MQVSIGTLVRVNHPITCLNPTEWFEVIEMKFDIYPNKVWVKGEETCWFNSNMITGINYISTIEEES